MSFLFRSFFCFPILLSLFFGSNSNNSCPAQHEQQCSLFSWPRIKNILVIVVALSILLLLHERTNEQTKAFHGRRDGDVTVGVCLFRRVLCHIFNSIQYTYNSSHKTSMLSLHILWTTTLYVFIVRVELSQFLFGIKRQYHIITMTIIS